jgi:DNA (cytosine-5)-methyltransferase 1
MGVLHQAKGQYRKQAFSEQLIDALREIGYRAEPRVLNAAEFGVPQRRSRLVIVGVHKKSGLDLEMIFALLDEERRRAISTSAESALSDLSESSLPLIDNNESGDRGKFQRVDYAGPKTAYQLLMNCGVQSEGMDSMRLPRHKPAVKKRFARMLRTCTRGVNITATQRVSLGMQKIRQIPMDGSTPAPTLTTLPDDIIHYDRPRILSVRECARLQSFPDWFVFRGKYTTGGLRRRTECPRYTQVGNAVPPLLAESLGAALITHLSAADHTSHDTAASVRPEQAAA